MQANNECRRRIQVVNDSALKIWINEIAISSGGQKRISENSEEPDFVIDKNRDATNLDDLEQKHPSMPTVTNRSAQPMSHGKRTFDIILQITTFAHFQAKLPTPSVIEHRMPNKHLSSKLYSHTLLTPNQTNRLSHLIEDPMQKDHPSSHFCSLVPPPSKQTSPLDRFTQH
ncbi:unnamed protein product [Rotaria magnacalcarata]|uniref:Uncharacterized protein n=1 Tax=Rotaria magnacalcarata TaxID=392030 RepID=A0A816TRL8_9BILA|nr:unnamed protein product [Rotaria magnacalcarata]CAF4314337.1 unnamed protein product [Rotaria magnacalcarata]